MTILLVGGGSGGHVAPLLAVAQELRKSSKTCRLVYVGEKSGKFVKMAVESEVFDEIRTVRAGKFRRYHGESWLKIISDLKTLALNIRDFFFMIVGIFQSVLLVRKEKPDIAFIKGGFVGVPLGVACKVTGTKYITHDSDTVPGLANKIIARWASWHAVGMPVDYYDYNKSKTSFTGIPIEGQFKSVSIADKNRFRDDLLIPHKSRVICITGGSLGAARLNAALEPIMARMLVEDENIFVIHQTGSLSSKLYDNLSSKARQRLILADFFNDLYRYTGASDVIITRAGATTIAALALQKKSIIVVPNPMLTGGHQTKNAQHLEHSEAAVVVNESDLEYRTVLGVIDKICADEDYSKKLASNLGLLARPNATREIVDLILKNAKTG